MVHNGFKERQLLIVGSTPHKVGLCTGSAHCVLWILNHWRVQGECSWILVYLLLKKPNQIKTPKFVPFFRFLQWPPHTRDSRGFLASFLLQRFFGHILH